MLDPKKVQEMDQTLATFTEFFPQLWHGLYEGLQREGFNADTALILLQTYIISQGSCNMIIPDVEDLSCGGGH